MPAALSIDKTLSQASRAAKSDDPARAYRLYRAVLGRFPANKRAQKGLEQLRGSAVPRLLELAQSAQQRGEWHAAEASLEAAADLAPQIPAIGLALAGCRFEMGRAPGALAVAEKILIREPNHPGALDAKGRALRDMGRTAEAETSLLAALGHGKTDATPLNHLGTLALSRGDKPAAEEYFRRAIALSPDTPFLHWNLASAIKYRQGEPHLDHMRKIAGASDPNDSAMAPLHFALFKAHDDLDETDRAFRHLVTANRLQKAGDEYDVRQDALSCALSKVLVNKPAPAATEGSGPRMIFVTGLPRSGTTLVERILSRADCVQPSGELTVVQGAAAKLLRDVQARGRKSLTVEDIAALRAEMLEGFAAYSDGRPVMVDKMPLNFRWIGYICAAMPEARIVHVNRDPVALAWSLFRHFFGSKGNGFVYDPADIVAYMIIHRDLMRHWRAIYPDRVFDLDYGALVTDPEAATKALAQATGLEWSSDWLSPEQSTAPVLTASADQVNKPIYRGSDAAWQRYEPHVQPILDALKTGGVT